MPEAPLLEARGVSVAFGGVRALDDVSFAVRRGEIFGVIGPNGAGKTTLLNTISAVYRPRSGAILVDGVDVTGVAPHRLARMGVARTFQIVQPFARMTVRENVLVGAMFGDRGQDAAAAAEGALVRTGLMGKASFMPPQLTLAERKRLEVARALAMRPRILLLDEVMAGLNHTEVERSIELFRALQADGLTIVIIEHVMRAVLALCDRLMVLNFGAKLAEGVGGRRGGRSGGGGGVSGQPLRQGAAGVNVLAVRDLVVSYGDSRILWGVDFEIAAGEVVALVGANGAGKTTLLRALTGLVASTGGIVLGGREMAGLPAYRRARAGLAMVPEGRRLFAGLTVRQNLEMGVRARGETTGSGDDLAFVFAQFPELVRLQHRLAGLLSGGEQQMCAIGRSLMARPRVLLVDEMSLGLAPVVVERLAAVIGRVNRERGVAILLVEQDVGLALEIAVAGVCVGDGADRHRGSFGGTVGAGRCPDRLSWVDLNRRSSC